MPEVSGVICHDGRIARGTGYRRARWNSPRSARSEAWRTLGFEATGPVSLLRGELVATAALVLAQALAAGVELGIDDSRSYAEWLRRRPGADSGAGA